jgi:hypothetical protein
VEKECEARWKTINEPPKMKRKRKSKRVKEKKKYNIIEIKRERWENPRENDNYINYKKQNGNENMRKVA